LGIQYIHHLADSNEINIYIGIYDNEENINKKSNIHRARLSKLKKFLFLKML